MFLWHRALERAEAPGYQVTVSMARNAPPPLTTAFDTLSSTSNSRNPSDDLLGTTVGELEQMIARLRADLEALQENNTVLIRERDQHKERAKREVKEAARVHREHQNLVKRLHCVDGEETTERCCILSALECLESLLYVSNGIYKRASSRERWPSNLLVSRAMSFDP